MKSDMENRDWLNDYKLLKQVNPANPFTVPDGYFDNLTDRIASFKNLGDLTNKEAGFSVPGNYFEELSNNIQSRVAIERVIDSNNEGFDVPEGYFEELSGNILSRIAIEQVPSSANNGFDVPEGYFDDLGLQIKSRILVEAALGDPEDHFSVPQGYFNELNQNILDKTVNFNKVKRNGVVRKMFASTAFKYATAACFTLVLGGGILLSELNSPANEHKNSFLHKQLSAVPVDDIKNYLQLNVDAGDAQQTVATEGVAVDANSLKNALQEDADSVQ
ncbi:MAG TPA: hypothetical protein VGI43_12940 [Mucilaginibacter sp.]|jgi:hypothetical protein